MLSDRRSPLRPVVPVVFDFMGESAATQNYVIWIVATTLSGGVGGLLVAIPACAEWKWRTLSRCGSVAIFGASGGLLFGGAMSILPEIMTWFLSIVVALFSWQLLVAAKLAAILAKDTDVPNGGSFVSERKWSKSHSLTDGQPILTWQSLLRSTASCLCNARAR